LNIDVAIELIIPDNTAFTVLTALRQLDYQELERVERSEHVLLSATQDIPAGVVVAQLAKAEVLFNPNKHRMSYALADAAFVEPPEFEALVRDKDEDNDRLCGLLKSTFGMSSLQRIERAVGWRLYEHTGPVTNDRLRWTCKTLLANPISQRFDIRRRPVRTCVGEPALAAPKRGK
jgi:phosphoribosylformylglycinamidine (FGAM) synthase PurS component